MAHQLGVRRARSSVERRQSKILGLSWKTTIALTLSVWLGATLLLDVVVMPTMYLTGMMIEPSFASVGYTLFGIFNRVELVGAALVLSGLMGWHYSAHLNLLRSKTTAIFAILIFVIPLTCLYGLTPFMSALSLNLDLFNSQAVPQAMFLLQGLYWALESLKLAGIITLLGVCHRIEA